MAQLYQWSEPCIICEGPVEYHCNTCGDVLCRKCRDNHTKSSVTKHHVVVQYSERVEPTPSSLQCSAHPDHQCGVWCETCNKAICQECLISPNHTGHLFLKIGEKLREKRRDIQGQFERYTKDLVDWQALLQEGENQKDLYEKHVEILDKEIADRADELCRQVRHMERESRKQLQEMKDASLAVYKKRQKAFANGVQNLQKKIKELEDTLRSHDLSPVLQYQDEETDINDTKPRKDGSPKVPTFTSESLNNEKIKTMFGCLVEKAHVPDESVIIIGKKYAPAIICLESGQAWIRTAPYRLQLVNRQGIAERTVKINFAIAGMALTEEGAILLPDYCNKCIKSMSDDANIKTLFDTKWKPHGICCLPNGDIVVAFRHDERVVQYSSTGEFIRQIGHYQSQYPWYVAYSQANKQLYVCEKSDPGNLGARGRVLFFDANSTLMHTYTGQGTSTLTPLTVCTDEAGHVLITDYSNNRVHILDKEGTFLKYLPTEKQGLNTPITIDVDTEGYAWIGEWHTGKLRVVKYIYKE